MAYSVECDTCEFMREINDEVTAYSVAKDHEAEYAGHFVMMERMP